MFQGSDNVGDEQHFKIITEAGGTLNGTTNTDRTNYFETVPSNQLEKMIWLEADRMGFLLDAVTQRKFEIQRETVKNERGQRVDNAPYGLVFELMGKTLYPYGHPYSWSTIGYIEDLNRVNSPNAYGYLLRGYANGFRDANINLEPTWEGRAPWDGVAWANFATAWRDGGYVVSWVRPGVRGAASTPGAIVAKIGSSRRTTSSSPPIIRQKPRSSPNTPPLVPTSTTCTPFSA